MLHLVLTGILTHFCQIHIKKLRFDATEKLSSANYFVLEHIICQHFMDITNYILFMN